MTARENVVLVARREYVERIRDRSFLVSTGVVVAILLFITVLPRILGAGEEETFTVGLVGEGSAVLARPLEAGAGSIGARVRTRGVPVAASTPTSSVPVPRHSIAMPAPLKAMSTKSPCQNL